MKLKAILLPLMILVFLFNDVLAQHIYITSTNFPSASEFNKTFPWSTTIYSAGYNGDAYIEYRDADTWGLISRSTWYVYSGHYYTDSGTATMPNKTWTWRISAGRIIFGTDYEDDVKYVTINLLVPKVYIVEKYFPDSWVMNESFPFNVTFFAKDYTGDAFIEYRDADTDALISRAVFSVSAGNNYTDSGTFTMPFKNWRILIKTGRIIDSTDYVDDQEYAFIQAIEPRVYIIDYYFPESVSYNESFPFNVTFTALYTGDAFIEYRDADTDALISRAVFSIEEIGENNTDSGTATMPNRDWKWKITTGRIISGTDYVDDEKIVTIKLAPVCVFIPCPPVEEIGLPLKILCVFANIIVYVPILLVAFLLLGSILVLIIKFKFLR